MGSELCCNLRERDHLSRSFFVHPLSLSLPISDGQTDADGRTAVIHNQTAAVAAASVLEEEEEKDNHALCTLIALVKTRKMLLALLSLHGQIDTRVSRKKGFIDRERRGGEGRLGLFFWLCLPPDTWTWTNSGLRRLRN